MEDSEPEQKQVPGGPQFSLRFLFWIIILVSIAAAIFTSVALLDLLPLLLVGLFVTPLIAWFAAAILVRKHRMLPYLVYINEFLVILIASYVIIDQDPAYLLFGIFFAPYWISIYWNRWTYGLYWGEF